MGPRVLGLSRHWPNFDDPRFSLILSMSTPSHPTISRILALLALHPYVLLTLLALFSPGSPFSHSTTNTRLLFIVDSKIRKFPSWYFFSLFFILLFFFEKVVDRNKKLRVFFPLFSFCFYKSDSFDSVFFLSFFLFTFVPSNPSRD